MPILTRLTCTHCGAEEFTTAPRIFRGDLCMDCGIGSMLDRPSVEASA